MRTKTSYPRTKRHLAKYRYILIFVAGVAIGMSADYILEPELYNNRTLKSSSKMLPSSSQADVNAVHPLTLNANQVMTCFSPAEKCAPKLIQLIDRAKESIDVRIYTFTSKDIAERLIAAKRRGVRVRVLCDREQRKNAYSRIKDLEAEGISVQVEKVSGLAHNKVMIIDHMILITGSYNFTQAAETRNAENMLILRQTELIERYQKDWELAWGKE